MEEQRSNAGQGLGIAGLVLGIMAIPMGIIPCTFYMGVLFGIVGIVISIVALTQANRASGPKGLIVAALVCSLVGLTFASVWGLVLSHGGANMVKEIIRERGFGPDFDYTFGDDDEQDTATYGSDTAAWPSSSDMKQMTDSLKMLEGEEE